MTGEAVRLRAVSLAALAARLNHRLALLTNGMPDQPLRLQTMRNAIAWSYDLLEEQRTVFRRLALFAGGFPLDAAVAVVPPEVNGIAGGDVDARVRGGDGAGRSEPCAALRPRPTGAAASH